MNTKNVRCAVIALTMFALIGLQGMRADSWDVQTSISEPLMGQAFQIYYGSSTTVSAASHHEVVFTNTTTNGLDRFMYLQIALRHYTSQRYSDSKTITAIRGQTYSYSYDLSDAGPYSPGGYSTQAETTVLMSGVLTDVDILVGWSVEGFLPVLPPTVPPGGGCDINSSFHKKSRSNNATKFHAAR